MQWKGRRQSANVEDRRGRRVSRGAAGLGGGGLLLIVLLAVFLGQDPVQVIQQIPAVEVPTDVGGSGPVTESGAEVEQREFVSVVLADTEDVWQALFRREGRVYEEPSLVLFRDAVQSGCGFAQAAVGPFYCPANRKLYLPNRSRTAAPSSACAGSSTASRAAAWTPARRSTNAPSSLPGPATRETRAATVSSAS